MVRVMKRYTQDGYCPVIHPGPWLSGYLDALHELGDVPQLAVGGLVQGGRKPYPVPVDGLGSTE